MTENSSRAVDYSILEGFKGGITPPRTSFLYLCGLVVVTVTMILLPLIYLLIVIGAGSAVFYHAVYDWRPIMDLGGFSGGPRIMIFKFLIFFTPLIAGVVVVFFLFKPIFARRPRQAQSLALNPATEPLLYAFIEKICQTVGAPSPRRIDLDCDLNASAGFRRGFLSFLGNDFVLVIGLPLAANLSTRELAGVVAHEFGHFSQGLGMRLSYFIRSVNLWFARVAYERDAWDMALENWSEEVQDVRATIIIWTIQLGVWGSRMVLRLLMFGAHIIGGFMLRQMEYDADVYQIKLVGSETFESTHRKLATLEMAMRETSGQMVGNWKKYRTLPDNLPELLRRQHEKLSPQVLQKINNTLGLRRTGIFDSHPSPADRIRQARKASNPGIFCDEAPATSLFSSFDHPSRFVTLLHYTDDLGIPVTQQMLTPVQTEMPTRASVGIAVPSADDLCETYFSGVLPLILPLSLHVPAPSSDWDADHTRLNQLSAGLGGVAEQLVSTRQEYDHATSKLIQARAAVNLLTNGVVVDPGQFGRSEPTVEAATSAEKEADFARKSLCGSLHEIASAQSQRLELGLALALVSAGDSTEQTPIAARVNELVSGLALAEKTYAQRLELAGALAVLDCINGHGVTRGGTPAFARAVERQKKIVQSLWEEFKDKPVPQAVKPSSGLRLQTATRPPDPESGDDLSIIEKQNAAWLKDYRYKLEELVQIAGSAAGGI